MPPAFVTRARDRLAGYLASHPRARDVTDLVQRVVRAQSAERIGLSAAGIAFWFVIAIFPALIAVVMILGLVLSPAEIASTLNELDKASPNSLGGPSTLTLIPLILTGAILTHQVIILLQGQCSISSKGEI